MPRKASGRQDVRLCFVGGAFQPRELHPSKDAQMETLRTGTSLR